VKLSFWVVCVHIQLLGFFCVAVGLAVLVALLGVVPVPVASATDEEEGDHAGDEDGDDDTDNDWYHCGAITREVHALKNK
jgi:hypothetical protein